MARRPGIEPPPWLASKGFDWKKGWSDAWRNTPEGSAYLDTLEHWFVKPEPDGHFHISGLQPGEYDFAVNLYGTVEGCLVHPVAIGVVHFSVGESVIRVSIWANCRSRPSPRRRSARRPATSDSTHLPAVSRAFQPFAAITYWSISGRPGAGRASSKLDQIERLREQFTGDKPLVVLGANLDANPLRVREFLKSKPLPWQHALLGDWSSTDVPRRCRLGSSGLSAD